jgi:hypothetical protein
MNLMDNAKYIELVKTALGSTENRIECIIHVAAIELPKDADPLIALIHGDALQLQDAINYAKNYDPVSPSDEAISKLSAALSIEIKQKLERYLADGDGGNTYRYSFELKATYGTFKNDRGEVEYIDVINRNTSIETIADAVRSAQEWESQLLERIRMYADQKTGHKRISVKPTYVIRDKKLHKVAAGTLEFDNGFGISTWLNQI